LQNYYKVFLRGNVFPDKLKRGRKSSEMRSPEQATLKEGARRQWLLNRITMAVERCLAVPRTCASRVFVESPVISSLLSASFRKSFGVASELLGHSAVSAGLRPMPAVNRFCAC
jgi:hypothetical protein